MVDKKASERDVREEQQYISVVRTSNNRVIMARDLYCCLLPQCEALCICRSGFLIATNGLSVVYLFFGKLYILDATLMLSTD